MSTKRKALALVKPVVKPSAKVATKSKIDETRTAVSTGPAVKSAPKAAAAASAPETIEISSDSSSHYSDSDNEDVNSDNEATTEAAAAPEKKKTTTETKPAQQAADAENDDDDDASPTFGDLARGNATIDVASALAAQEAASAAEASASTNKNNQTITVQRASGQTSTISATSLGTVLNQALRTDDSDLLESCLQTSDPKIITNTITRMDSALAGVLLSKLAARMHRRPGRAFGLMKWIQTTLVAHGGSLVAQPEVVARLGELNRVLEERARGLPALLALKGKLDMLDQQMRWRKFVKQGGAAAAAADGEDSDEEEEEDVDEPGVVYVEGEENEVQQGGKSAGAEEDFALIDVGADGESDEEEGDEDEDDEEDDEEFDDAESLDEDEVDHDDVEESGDEDEDDEEDDDEDDEAPPAKVQKTSSSKFNKRK
ncbi:Dip2/Utp12 family-domain-containing protein [Sordaria brevicollis]|uniref:Dip2/Utp12 family-domain-containing protein n=1 Tax=Sordaria brevicollis TaxID=83679 RepID=A0AAE0UAH7_SORBR|nr:Dip2/Utp12 family-domain-containing protein [Sordaria brevicollis]